MFHVKKLHPKGMLPVRSGANEVGYDVFAIDDGQYVIDDGSVEFVQYNLGISVQPISHIDDDIDKVVVDYSKYLMITPRSSISKYDLLLCNSPSVIDGSYTGQISLRFKLLKPRESAKIYGAGDRIAQIIIQDRLSDDFVWSDTLMETQRGDKGFGASGK